MYSFCRYIHDGITRKMFNLKYTESLIEFNQIAIATADGTGSENMLNRVMTKDNIAISALLQTKDGAFDPTNMPDPSNTRQSVMVSFDGTPKCCRLCNIYRNIFLGS